jgi:hypothetical protein
MRETKTNPAGEAVDTGKIDCQTICGQITPGTANGLSTQAKVKKLRRLVKNVDRKIKKRT